MEPVSVLSLTPYRVLPAIMGGHKGIALFNEYLAKKVTLTVASVKSNDFSLAKGYRMLPVFSDSPLRYINLYYFFALRKIVRQNNIRHVIVEHPYYGWLGLLLKWFCGCKLIIHSHNIEALRWKSTGHWWWRILGWYEKNVHQRADMNFFIHEEDRNYAQRKYAIAINKSTVVTYGIPVDSIPLPAERAAARKQLQQIHPVKEGEIILLFNGTLNYLPNTDALNIILQYINPLLLSIPGYRYKIIICGNKLPATYNNLSAYYDKNIIFAGFVPDISIYLKGADIFLNPVTEGGGIKTKVVEALAYNMTVISTESGALGIPLAITGNKLKIVPDVSKVNKDWSPFIGHIQNYGKEDILPASFFEHFYWGNIAKKAAEVIAEL
jgi:polysaccharide biosynthesis protein PslH